MNYQTTTAYDTFEDMVINQIDGTFDDMVINQIDDTDDTDDAVIADDDNNEFDNDPLQLNEIPSFDTSRAKKNRDSTLIEALEDLEVVNDENAYLIAQLTIANNKIMIAEAALEESQLGLVELRSLWLQAVDAVQAPVQPPVQPEPPKGRFIDDALLNRLKELEKRANKPQLNAGNAGDQVRNLAKNTGFVKCDYIKTKKEVAKGGSMVVQKNGCGWYASDKAGNQVFLGRNASQVFSKLANSRQFISLIPTK